MPTMGQTVYYKIPGSGQNWDGSQTMNYVAIPWAGNDPQGYTEISKADYISGLQQSIASNSGDFVPSFAKNTAASNLANIQNQLNQVMGGGGIFADNYKDPTLGNFQANAPTPSEQYYTPEYRQQLANSTADMINIGTADKPMYVPAGSAGDPTNKGGTVTASTNSTAPANLSSTGSSQFNLSDYIGTRPSAHDSKTTEYYDKTTGQGYSNPQQLYDAIYSRTGQKVSSFDQVNSLLNTGGTPAATGGSSSGSPTGSGGSSSGTSGGTTGGTTTGSTTSGTSGGPTTTGTTGGTTNTTGTSGSTTPPPTTNVATAPTNVNFTDSAAYKSLSPDEQAMVNTMYNTYATGTAQQQTLLIQAVTSAAATADPYYRSLMDITMGEFGAKVAAENNDFATQSQIIKTTQQNLLQNVNAKESSLTLQNQSDLAKISLQYNNDLLNTQGAAADKGVVEGSGYGTLGYQTGLLTAQSENSIISTQVQYNYQLQALQLQASQGDVNAQQKLQQLQQSHAGNIGAIGASAEQTLGTSNVDKISGLTGVTGGSYVPQGNQNGDSGFIGSINEQHNTDILTGIKNYLGIAQPSVTATGA